MLLPSLFLSGDVPAEDPVHGSLHCAHVEQVSQQAAVVFCLHVVWRGHISPVETCRGIQYSGEKQFLIQLETKRSSPVFLFRPTCECIIPTVYYASHRNIAERCLSVQMSHFYFSFIENHTSIILLIHLKVLVFVLKCEMCYCTVCQPYAFHLCMWWM